MFPTLLIGDHLFVNKFIYGVQFPFTERAACPGCASPSAATWWSSPWRDRAVRRFPRTSGRSCRARSSSSASSGCPAIGSTSSTDGVYVNGEPVEATRPQDEFFEDDRGQHLAGEPGVAARPGLPRARRPASGSRRPQRRTRSPSSRAATSCWATTATTPRTAASGARALAEIKGPAFMLYWSWSFNGDWLELLRPVTWWGADVRWGRIGQAIQ